MKSFTVHIHTQDDLVLSERSATEGGHRSLDHVPGNALLGWAAGRLYADLGAKAWSIFHAGKVRFGNALPLTPDGTLAFPMPLCWHAPKGVAVTDDAGRLDTKTIVNLVHGDLLGAQPVQLREGYITPDLRVVKPLRDAQMRTSIDAKTRRAKEAALFGYESLADDTHLLATVSADDDVNIEPVKGALQGTLRLGRSRSAEYGTATATVRTEAPAFAHQAADGLLVLWLLSDLAAVDAYGQPTLNPTAKDLGLPEAVGALLLNKSFIRARRYSPWNAKRGGPDLERQLIQQGSVLVYACDANDRAAIYAAMALGLGMHRECGLGQVWADPPLLAATNPAKQNANHKVTLNAATEKQPATAENSLLIAWLTGRAAFMEAKDGRLAPARIEQIVRDYREKVELARNQRGVQAWESIGPSASQWGAVLSAARGAPEGKLFDALFGNNGKVRGSAKGWCDAYMDLKESTKPTSVSFALWFKRQLADVHTVNGVEVWNLQAGITPRGVMDLAAVLRNCAKQQAR